MLTTRCVRGLSSIFCRRLVSVPEIPEIPEIPTVTKMEETKKGKHYAKSYRDFTSWLNCGGHAEVFEGCTVIGKVIKVFYQIRNTDLVENIETFKQVDSSVLIVDWGHKHLGVATLGPSQTCPDIGSNILCKLIALEHTQHTMGHSIYERHNEALLQYISTLPLTS